jgi:ABC-2 type transport system permease protein
MKRDTLLLFLRKELSDLRSNRQVWPAYMLLPLVAILLPLLLLALLPVLLQQGQTGQDAAITMLLETVARDTSLRGTTQEERLARLLMRDLTMFYLLMPIVLSASAAALALVREKEQRTLEPILATPIRDRDLLLAKLVASVVPAMLITWAAFVAGSLMTAAGSWWTVDAIILPTSGNLVALLLLAPAMSVVAALLALRVSARFTDVPGAMQFTGLVVVPLTLILVALLGRPAMMWPLVGLAGAILLCGLAYGLFRMNLRRFAREEILTKWK